MTRPDLDIAAHALGLRVVGTCATCRYNGPTLWHEGPHCRLHNHVIRSATEEGCTSHADAESEPITSVELDEI